MTMGARLTKIGVQIIFSFFLVFFFKILPQITNVLVTFEHKLASHYQFKLCHLADSRVGYEN